MKDIKENKFNNFYLTDLKEQETIVNIDYYQRVVYIYTCRKSVADRLRSKLGEPQKIYYIKNKISGIRYEVPFGNKKELTSILSRPLLIGNMK